MSDPSLPEMPMTPPPDVSRGGAPPAPAAESPELFEGGEAGAADVTIVGLGPAGLALLTEPARHALRTARRLLLRTDRHPAANELRSLGIAFETLDALYAEAPGFEALYPMLAEAVLHAARSGPVVYAVPGHPLLGEESVRILLRRAAEEGLATRLFPALSFVDVVAPALAAAGEIPRLDEWQIADGAALRNVWWDPERPVLIFQIDDPLAASRVKLALLDEYPDEWSVALVRHAGQPGRESVLRLPLWEMDRPAAGEYDHLTTLYVPPLPPERRRPDFRRFVEVVAALRGPEGCPWDREQTHASLQRYLLEEAYELLEAIDSEDPERLCEELGDLMLQVLMHAQIGAETGYFDIRDVIAGIVEKLIRRHPHVFGDAAAASAEEVLRNWEALKRKEKPERASVLDGVPRELPALMKALEVSKRVVRVGFEWPSLEELLAKLDEEIGELKAELAAPDRQDSGQRLRDEIGDLLFTIVNLARWLKVDPEEALRQMIERFGRRFREVERLAAEQGRPVSELGIRELDRLWEEAKRRERE